MRLSTAGFMDGAVKGYQFAQGIEDNKLRKQEIEANRGLRDAEEGRRQESHQIQMEDAAEQKKYNALRIQDFDESKAEKANQLVAMKMRAMSNNGIEWTPENQKALSEFGRMADPEYLLSPQTDEALSTIENLFSKKISMNDPAVISAANYIFNVQRGAKDGSQVSINKIVPARDGSSFHIGLQVKRSDGSAYDAPMTNNRSSDPDDEVTTVSMDEFMEMYGALKKTRSALGNPKMAQAFMDHYAPGETLSAKDQSAINLNNARADHVKAQTANEKNNSSAGGRGGQASGLEKEVEYLKSIGLSQEAALDIATNGKQNPAGSIIAIAKAINEGEGLPIREAIDQAKSIYEEKLGRKLTKPEEKTIENTVASQQVNQLTNGAPDDSVPIPMRKPQAQAPASAIQYLKSNPDMAEAFQAKYGYLPE